MTRKQLLEAYVDPRLSARLARTRYQMDDSPGWSRTRRGKVFIYTTETGKVVRNAKEIARIDALGIPPAWKDVWIAPKANGHLQATGIDAKGRKQYRYHPHWTAFREQLKFSRLAAFAEALPKLRAAMTKSLRAPEPTCPRVAALALRLVDELGIRIGTEAYAKENKTYGVTTLQNRHLSIERGTVTLSFVGKSGKEHELSLKDAKLAELLAEEKALPGARLFQYIDDDGKRHALAAEDVNAFIQGATGGDFTAKDFRTWIGTVYAYELMSDACSPKERITWTEKEYKKSLVQIVKDVAERLGNTAAVTRAHYIHAGLQTQYCPAGFRQLQSRIKRMKKPAGLGKEEGEVAALLAILEKEKKA